MKEDKQFLIKTKTVEDEKAPVTSWLSKNKNNMLVLPCLYLSVIQHVKEGSSPNQKHTAYLRSHFTVQIVMVY